MTEINQSNIMQKKKEKQTNPDHELIPYQSPKVGADLIRAALNTMATAQYSVASVHLARFNTYLAQFAMDPTKVIREDQPPNKSKSDDSRAT
jgi:hypothetical protein